MSGLSTYKGTKRISPDVEREARNILMDFFQEKFPELREEWYNLNASEKWNVAMRMLPYIAPKLATVTVQGDSNNAISLLISMAQNKNGNSTALPT